MTTTDVDVAFGRGEKRRSVLFAHEDYWAIWLGAFILIVGLVANYVSLPADIDDTVQSYRATLTAEEARAPFRTLAWHETNDKLAKLQSSRVGVANELRQYLARPGRWSDAPLESFIVSEEEAAAKNAKAKEKHDAAAAKLAETRAAAESAEAAAAGAGFADAALNEVARTAIGAWRTAHAAEAKAKTAATGKPSNIVWSLIVLAAGTGLLFAVGAWFIGWSVPRFLIAYPFVFALATLAYFIAAQSDIRAWGLEYVLWAIVIGLIISNTVGTPEWLKPAVQVEYYIKTGLVLLGASILIGKILIIGVPGIIQTWVVTPIVLIVTYWFGQRILKMESKRLNIVVSADMAVSGVSAAIATAAAARATKEELTLAVGISIIFTSIGIFAMPAVANWVGMNEVLAGAWIGGSIDATGAVVATGALVGDVAVQVAATIKLIQNILIGVIAFGVAAYFAIKVDRTPGAVDLSFAGALREIWLRFPKFIFGFLGASLIFSFLYYFFGDDLGRILIDDGVIRGWSTGLQGWFFALAFVSIGLETNFRELGHLLKGAKPLILYVFGQSLQLALTLSAAYVLFFKVFPWVTERLLAG